MSLSTFLSRFAAPRRVVPRMPAPVSGVRAFAVVIDDDPGMRSLMAVSLEQCGYRVIDVASGHEAIDAAQRVPHIDLIVADLELNGGLQGPALVNALRLMNGYMPVVFVSDRSAGVIGVADPVLRKPFLGGEWLNAVSSVVGVLPRDRSIGAA